MYPTIEACGNLQSNSIYMCLDMIKLQLNPEWCLHVEHILQFDHMLQFDLGTCLLVSILIYKSYHILLECRCPIKKRDPVRPAYLTPCVCGQSTGTKIQYQLRHPSVQSGVCFMLLMFPKPKFAVILFGVWMSLNEYLEHTCMCRQC